MMDALLEPLTIGFMSLSVLASAAKKVWMARSVYKRVLVNP